MILLYIAEILCSVAGLGTFWWLMREPHRSTPIRVPKLGSQAILTTMSSSPTDYVGYV